MQDRYAGDVGDFGKYGLLRALCTVDADGPELELGVQWYLFPNEGEVGVGDGKHTNYLKGRGERDYRPCDPALYDEMRAIVNGGDRSVAAIERRGVLSEGTRFFSEELSFEKGEPKAARSSGRKRWLERAFERLRGSDLVFADPDNGLQVDSVSKLALKGPKYAYYSDLRPLVARDQSPVIYHHLGRSHRGRPAGAAQQIAARLGELADLLPTPASPMALRYRRGSPHVFFVVPAERHAKLLQRRAARFLDSPWRRHFEFVDAAPGA